MSKKVVKIVGFVVVMICAVIYVNAQKNKPQVAQLEPQVKKINLPQIANDLLTPNPQPTSALSEEWQEVGNGVALKAVLYSYNGSSYKLQVVRINPNLNTISLQYDQVGKQITDWAQDNPKSIVSNAGFFKENNAPVGLLYIDGKRIDNHRINPVTTGLLHIIDNGVKILNLKDTPLPTDSELRNALQTYPVLIDNSKNVASKNLVKQDRRSAIGGDASGNVYLITAPYAHLGLYDFAKTIQDSSLQLTEVLNLDGGGSTGVAVQTREYTNVIDSQTAVPTVLVFTPKES